MSIKKKLIIIGAGGHGKVCTDIAKHCGYEDISFLDDNAEGFFGDYKIAGKVANYKDHLLDSCFFVAIGNGEVRRKFYEMLEKDGADIVSLIHPFTSIAEDVQIEKGSVVMAGAVINPGTVIGKGTIINTCASVDHDCNIAGYVHVAVGAHICGTVSIGNNVWIGAGSTVINNVSICDDCFIGAGAVVVKNLDASGKYIGVPAKMKE